MRLLNTQDWTFHTHRENERYCILSHRWHDDDDQEIHYEDARAGNWKAGTTGHTKLSSACKIAQKLGFQWIWIDTCCIKRDSDSELSESINSMYKWYANASVCLAYLSDVTAVIPGVYKDPVLLEKELRQSSWFGRGWTLQEMLAPSDVRFYDGDFNFIGTKIHLSEQITSITGIAGKYLVNPASIRLASIATLISWASKRQTKRKEDEAYCLLGLLGINMSLIYGEGDSAFFRLQLELLSRSDDETIFAWISEECKDDNMLFGMLATSPRDFAGSSEMEPVHMPGVMRPPFRWTNHGLEICRRETLPFVNGGMSETSLVLACKRHADTVGELVRVELLRIEGVWYRTRCHEFLFSRDTTIPLAEQLSLGWGWSRFGFIETLYIAQPSLGSFSRSLLPKTAADISMSRKKQQEYKNMLLGFAIYAGIFYVMGFPRHYLLDEDDFSRGSLAAYVVVLIMSAAFSVLYYIGDESVDRTKAARAAGLWFILGIMILLVLLWHYPLGDFWFRPGFLAACTAIFAILAFSGTEPKNMQAVVRSGVILVIAGALYALDPSSRHLWHISFFRPSALAMCVVVVALLAYLGEGSKKRDMMARSVALSKRLSFPIQLATAK